MTDKVRHIFRLAMVLTVAAIALAGCKSARNAGRTDRSQTGTEYLSSRLELTMPVKDAVYTVDGTMKMKSGEMVQISLLMPVLRSEVARLQVTPRELLVVDRMNRRYARAGESELKYVAARGYSFDRLEKTLKSLAQGNTKKTLSGEDLGLANMSKLKVEFRDFSTDSVSITPTELSSRYKMVTLEELLQMLTLLNQ